MIALPELAVAVMDAAVRWTAVFALAWAILRASRLSAAARHHVWAMLLAGLLLLPLAAKVLPTHGVARPVALAPRVGGPAASVAPDALGPTAGSAAGSELTTEPVSRPAFAPGAAAAPGRGARAGGRRAIGAWAWLVGTLALLSYWIAGQCAVRSLARRSQVASDAQQAVLRACAGRMGIRRDVRLLRSAEERVPMTWGAFRPVILLPGSSTSWSPETLRRVLLHELAHVARFDAPVQSITRITCSVFWFHPAVWYAARCLRWEAEVASDDAVLEVEGTPFAYAEDLLGIARTSGSVPRFTSALPMARGRGLDRRIRALVEAGRRRGLSRRLAGVVTIGLTLLVGAVAIVRWIDPSASGGATGFRQSVLGDGRSVWTMECGSAERPICVDGGRRAVALLERTGRTGAVIAQRVSTGEVVMYAAVRGPGSDPADAMPRVPPGSVAKLALAALWWDDGRADSLAPCPAETRLPSGRPLGNVGGYAVGPVSAEEMLVVSCNTAAVAMAARLVEAFGSAGFVRALQGTGLAAEAPGTADERGGHTITFAGSRTAESAAANDLPLLAGLGMTRGTLSPLRISGFLQAVGNGGVRLQAHPALGGDGGDAPRRVMGRDAATRLQGAMLRVVAEGTAARALPQLEWSRWTLGGKTGTVPGDAGEPSGWFAGLAHGPDGRAEYTIVVLVEGGGVGGRLPAGIAAEMTRLFARIDGDEL